jgi:lipooligosaccharide transport system permease protein|uniref:ABC transporter permease n=1 Tax=Candidatus Planktophila sp. TaxID=2175601 RepID=UPI00404B69CC
MSNKIRPVSKFGTLHVAEARIRNMAKWIWIILFAAVVNPTLYLVSIGIGVGSLIDANNGVDGVSYLTFLAPALLASAAIQGSSDEVIFPTMAGFKWERTFFGMRSTPLTARQISFGIFIAAMVRTIVSVVIYWIVLYLFGALESDTAWLAMPAALFAGAAMAAVMLALAAKIEKEDFFFTLVGRFVMIPMFLFSGTFYPLSQMPVFLQVIGWISPLWHATELGRYLTYDYPLSGLQLFTHIGVLTTMIVVGLFFAARFFDNRLEK